MEREELPLVEKLVGRRSYGVFVKRNGTHLELKVSGLRWRSNGVKQKDVRKKKKKEKMMLMGR